MFRVVLTLALLFVICAVSQTAGAQKREFGPAVRNYLLSLDEESKELDFQLRQKEMSRAIHLKARARLQILRRFVEQLAAERDEDRVPELEVLTAEELGALGLATRPDPLQLQAGMRFADRWEVVAIESGRPSFFVFERLPLEGASRSKPGFIDPLAVIETIVVDGPVERPPEVKAPVIEPAAAEPAPIAPPPPPQLEGPKILRFFLPSYSQQARAKGIEGDLIVSAVFRRDGKIKDIVVEQGLGQGLDERAKDSVRRTEFEPGLLAHQPVDVRARILFNFSLMRVTVRVRDHEPVGEVKP